MSDQYRDSVRQMDRNIYEQLVNSLATGRWPDGRTLTADQRAHAMQAVITWGEMHLPPEEGVGFIDKGIDGNYIDGTCRNSGKSHKKLQKIYGHHSNRNCQKPFTTFKECC